MKVRHGSGPSALPVVALALFMVACASSKRGGSAPPAESPAASPQQAAPAYSARETTDSLSRRETMDAKTAEPSATAAPSPATQQAPGAGGYAPAPPRAVAISQAANDIDTSQRELDVAGGDCRNACRALGSMDRATGHLCSLAQSNDEVRKCDDAKSRVYAARDKVRNTCGTCDDVSVDRAAPIPSRR